MSDKAKPDQHDHQREREQSIQQLAKLIEKVEIAMLTTEQSDGTLRSRPMATQQAPFDGTLWFLTSQKTAKIDEIKGHTRVNVAYANPSANTFVSVSGCAEVIKDAAKVREFWNESYKVWFPDGPDDPDVVLLKIDVEQAEYWENNRLMTLLGFAKAYLKGEEYQGEGSDHAKLSLSHRG